MHQPQHRDPRNMQKQHTMLLPQVHNSIVTDSKDTKVNEMLDKEFKRMIFRKFNDIQENTNKKLND